MKRKGDRYKVADPTLAGRLDSVKADFSLPELDDPRCSDLPSLSRHSVVTMGLLFSE